MAFQSIHKDNNAKSGWKKVFKVLYYLWYIIFFSRFIIKLSFGGKFRDKENIDFWTGLSLFWLITYCGLYITYWIKPSWFRISKEQKVEGCDAEKVD